MRPTPIAKNRVVREAALAALSLAAGIAACFALAACGPRGEPGAENPNTPLAEVDGRKITVGDLQARLERVPRLARAEFTGETGRARMVRRMVEEEVLLKAARAEGVDRDPEVKAKLDEAERELIVQAFLDKKQAESSEVSEDEARAYYEAHPEEYTSEEALRVRIFFLKDRDRAARVQEMVSGGTLRFEEACRRHSDNPEIAAAQGLVPEWVRKGRAVQWIGNHPKFHEIAFALPLGEVSPLIELPTGYVFLRVDEKRAPELRSFEESRADIEGRLSRQKSAEALPKLVEDLKTRYRVKIFEPEGKSAEELFAGAQSEPDPHQRIKLYQEILDRHGDDVHAVEALFMIGFIQSEELGDRTAAKEAFERVIRDYPSADLAESARWMLSEESQKPPPFEMDSTRAESGGAS
jgi:peptidyl-prolyl cis-trans isomerase C